MEEALALISLVLYFAWADRFCGGGFNWKPSIPGRPIYYVLGGVLLAFGAIRLLAFEIWKPEYAYISGAAIMWIVWRWPGWKLFGGSLAPSNSKEIWGTVLRHSLLFGVLLATPTFHTWMAAGLITCLVLMYTAFHVQIRLMSNVGVDIIPRVELARGAMFGATLATIIYV